MRVTDALLARCACGNVEFRATGAPLASVVCYCDDCQEGGRQIESLANAAPVLDADGGTRYLVYRKDRVRCLKGSQALRACKIRERSSTSRVVAMCCNSAMILTFDDSKHWVDLYLNHVRGNAPPIQMHIFTKYRSIASGEAPTVPEFAKYPLSFVAKLVAAKIAMLVGK